VLLAQLGSPVLLPVATRPVAEVLVRLITWSGSARGTLCPRRLSESAISPNVAYRVEQPVAPCPSVEHD